VFWDFFFYFYFLVFVFAGLEYAIISNSLHPKNYQTGGSGES
jgi:hypothetical protein